MQALLDQLISLSLKNIQEPEEQGICNWYMISDKITGIKARAEDRVHPCLILMKPNIRSGRVDIWIRSTTREGVPPDYLLHRPHNHGTGAGCPLNVDAYISIRDFVSLPATEFLSLKARSQELDQDWLKSFQKCYFSIFQSFVARV